MPANRPRPPEERPPRPRRHRAAECGTSPPYYPITYAPAPEHHAWALVHGGWLEDPTPRERWELDRAGAWRHLPRALTHLDDAGVAAFLREDRAACKILTGFGSPLVRPGAVEGFVESVSRARREQLEAVARLDAYDALLVGAGLENWLFFESGDEEFRVLAWHELVSGSFRQQPPRGAGGRKERPAAKLGDMTLLGAVETAGPDGQAR